MRCAYCHDGDALERLPRCVACGSRLHEGCWIELHGRCPTLACGGQRARGEEPRREAERSSRWVWAAGASLCAVSGGLTAVSGVLAQTHCRPGGPLGTPLVLLTVVLALLHLFVLPALWVRVPSATGVWGRVRRLASIQLVVVPLTALLALLLPGGPQFALGVVEPLIALGLLSFTGAGDAAHASGAARAGLGDGNASRDVDARAGRLRPERLEV